MQNFLVRITSRKFILATCGFVALILSTFGVVDASREAELASGLSIVSFILVEGIRDVVRS